MENLVVINSKGDPENINISECSKDENKVGVNFSADEIKLIKLISEIFVNSLFEQD